MNPTSTKLFQEARRHIAGGVNSAVRAFKSVGGEPVFFARGEGAYLWDVDGKKYIDYVGSWGPAILGHAHPAVLKAVEDAARNGLSFGAPTAIETEMAQRIKSFMPSIEKLRMVSSGTEATMSAIRLARGYTGRDKIIKFEGCYHGSGDSLLVKAGSSALTLGVPSSPGVPKALAELTLTLEHNHLEPVRAAFKTHGQEIACVIVEPVAGNMNCVPPLPGFLAGLRALCTEHGALLIFDEVMTGFRVGLGGAQALYSVKPRPHHARQGHRWRPAGRRLRRTRRDHGPPHARRPGVSRRHAFGQSGGHGLRAGDAEASRATRFLRGAHG